MKLSNPPFFPSGVTKKTFFPHCTVIRATGGCGSFFLLTGEDLHVHLRPLVVALDQEGAALLVGGLVLDPELEVADARGERQRLQGNSNDILKI